MARPWASGGGAAQRQACLGCEGGRLGPGGAKSPEHLGFQVQTGLHWRHSPSKMDPSSAHEPRGLHGTQRHGQDTASQPEQAEQLPGTRWPRCLLTTLPADTGGNISSQRRGLGLGLGEDRARFGQHDHPLTLGPDGP